LEEIGGMRQPLEINCELVDCVINPVVQVADCARTHRFPRVRSVTSGLTSRDIPERWPRPTSLACVLATERRRAYRRLAKRLIVRVISQVTTSARSASAVRLIVPTSAQPQPHWGR